MPLAKDPAGLTQSDYNLNPRKAGFNTVETRARKVVSQTQVGSVLDHIIDKDLSFTARAYVESYNFLRVMGGVANVVFSS
jgi:hypothetical protein